MRFLTKRWFRLSQNVFEDAEINPRAAAFSETYYQELYTQKLMEYLEPSTSDDYGDEGDSLYDDETDSFDDYSDQPDDDLPEFEYQTWVEIGSWPHNTESTIPEPDTSELSDHMPQETKDKVDEVLDEMRQALLSQLDQLSEAELAEMTATTDEAELIENTELSGSEDDDDELQAFADDVANFEEILSFRMEQLRSSLPDYILDDIADLRILALGEAAPDIKDRLDELAEENRDEVEDTMSELAEEIKRAFNGRTPDIVRQLNLHDCRVTNIEWDGEELVLDLDNTSGFTNICRVSFNKIALLQLDGPLTDAYFVALEIYPHEAGYEIHALLQSELGDDPDGLMYFTLLSESVEALSTKIRTRRL